ncbi:glutamate racemase [Vibrio sp. 10N.286.49.C2]|uniref:glutamate racemase n=1 Tax=unclassified Vibrio TaxID=2614977 RepID=UPI000C83D8E6|nr:MULTISPECIES: glutamate racemase [unclassified Vibrio]PMH37396.1 glutamate racemase [Vibrio sp. 10N.286.49.C2]PMH49484.1 glutamate racemase [Vibrio sp. 10N.286.49.B1]PMH81545.1 glutamate racemase [Vibrio sp. 10N.286.48.B7]
MSNLTNRKNILIFDSGVGGLSVFQEIYTRLPLENYIYLFDNEAYPYGELSQETLIDRTCTLIKRMLTTRTVDIIVIACNTASTIVLPHLRQQTSTPVVGVVPAIKPASLLSKTAVALIATPATITRQYTHDLIRDFSTDREVKLLGSTRLVELAESKLRGEKIAQEEVNQILSTLNGCIDVAVLGCTHFPLLKEEIGVALGENVELIDSGEAIARRVECLLGDRVQYKKAGEMAMFCSAPPEEEAALNKAIQLLGFPPIQLFPLQDA